MGVKRLIELLCGHSTPKVQEVQKQKRAVAVSAVRAKRLQLDEALQELAQARAEKGKACHELPE